MANKKDIFIEHVISLCLEYGFCISCSDPYEGLNVIPIEDAWLNELKWNLSRYSEDRLPF